MKVIDFPLNTDASNVSEITLTARYPEKGYALNTISEMVVYILDGQTQLVRHDTTENLCKGDVVLISTHEKYVWNPEKEVTLLIFSTPPWTSSQQKIEL
jgi:mannose-6-phosphate isomerase-like protein (cupin superfamily)